MTSSMTTTPADTRATPVDLRARTRLLAALLLPVGPAAIAVLRYVLPYKTTDSGTELVQQVAAHQTAQTAVVWLGFIASLTLVPAVLSAGRVARREAPRLTAAAMLLLVPAYLSIGWLVTSDAAVLFAVRHGLSADDAAASYEALHPSIMVAGGIFVARSRARHDPARMRALASPRIPALGRARRRGLAAAALRGRRHRREPRARSVRVGPERRRVRRGWHHDPADERRAVVTDVRTDREPRTDRRGAMSVSPPR